MPTCIQHPLQSVRRLGAILVCATVLFMGAAASARAAGSLAPSVGPTAHVHRDPNTPEGVALHLYDLWLRPGTVVEHPPQLVDVRALLTRRYFSRLDADYRAGRIDVDPITQNQSDTLSARIAGKPVALGKGRVKVPMELRVGFSRPGQPLAVSVVLRRENGQWRVDDVTSVATTRR